MIICSEHSFAGYAEAASGRLPACERNGLQLVAKPHGTPEPIEESVEESSVMKTQGTMRRQRCHSQSEAVTLTWSRSPSALSHSPQASLNLCVMQQVEPVLRFCVLIGWGLCQASVWDWTGRQLTLCSHVEEQTELLNIHWKHQCGI